MHIKYRIGIMPGPWPKGREGVDFLWALTDFLERSGIDSLWLSDRLSSPTPVPEVMTTLAAVAARTQTLKFGPSVIVLPYRTPVVAAKEMATLDWLSRGRFFPAVGVGVELPREFDASGVPFKERGRRTDEAIHVIRLLWTAGRGELPGRVLQARPRDDLPQALADPAPHLDRRQERGGHQAHRAASATAGCPRSSRPRSSVWESTACRSWRPRPGARCPRTTSAR